MKKLGKSSANSLIAGALVGIVILAGAASTNAQTDPAISEAQTHDQQQAISPTPPATIFKTLVNFTGTNGAQPGRTPIQGTDGNLYGGTGSGGQHGQGTLYGMSPTGTLKTLYNFCAESGCPDGQGGGLSVLGGDGNFYGTTPVGGLLAMAQSSSSRKKAS